ncbi:hypothetical protein U1Q18_051449 [Sarracenia purpurea var. burkii]
MQANPFKSAREWNANGKKAGKAARVDEAVVDLAADSDEDLQVTRIKKTNGKAKQVTHQAIDLTQASPVKKSAPIFRPPKPPLPPFPTRENVHVQPAEPSIQEGERSVSLFERRPGEVGKTTSCKYRSRSPQRKTCCRRAAKRLPLRTSPRKRKVQRKVERKPGRKRRRVSSDEELDSLDDWIASDSETIEEDGDWRAKDSFFENFQPRIRAENDELGSSVRPSQESSKSEKTAASDATLMPAGEWKTPIQKTTVPALSFRDSDILTNCIVLHGPSGCGKTAMIYACAAELGYEVFELYPGMGKRSGHALEAAVGDLAKNHMVFGGGAGGGATFKTKSVLDLMRKRKSGSPEKPKPADVLGKSAGKQQTRQSIILIEEADLLYEEDKGFWVGVVELVAKSRRPSSSLATTYHRFRCTCCRSNVSLASTLSRQSCLNPTCKRLQRPGGKNFSAIICARLSAATRSRTSRRRHAHSPQMAFSTLPPSSPSAHTTT